MVLFCNSSALQGPWSSGLLSGSDRLTNLLEVSRVKAIPRIIWRFMHGSCTDAKAWRRRPFLPASPSPVRLVCQPYPSISCVHSAIQPPLLGLGWVRCCLSMQRTYRPSCPWLLNIAYLTDNLIDSRIFLALHQVPTTPSSRSPVILFGSVDLSRGQGLPESWL